MVWYYPIPFLPWPIQRLTHHLKALFSKECKLNSANEWSLCVCVCTITQVCVLVAQPCLTLCDPTDCNPPGFTIHGILQARILEWIAIPFSIYAGWKESEVAQLCLTLCDPMDCRQRSLVGYVHGVTKSWTWLSGHMPEMKLTSIQARDMLLCVQSKEQCSTKPE